MIRSGDALFVYRQWERLRHNRTIFPVIPSPLVIRLGIDQFKCERLALQPRARRSLCEFAYQGHYQRWKRWRSRDCRLIKKDEIWRTKTYMNISAYLYCHVTTFPELFVWKDMNQIQKTPVHKVGKIFYRYQLIAVTWDSLPPAIRSLSVTNKQCHIVYTTSPAPTNPQ